MAKKRASWLDALGAASDYIIALVLALGLSLALIFVAYGLGGWIAAAVIAIICPIGCLAFWYGVKEQEKSKLGGYETPSAKQVVDDRNALQSRGDRAHQWKQRRLN